MTCKLKLPALLALAVTILVAAASPVTAKAAKAASSLKIYINPGHGGWGPNDRPMATIPYPMLSSTGRPDTCGFYESNTNLWKCLKMREVLIKMGVSAGNIKMSRVKNGPYPYSSSSSDAKKYDRSLSEICTEVNTFAPDMFISVHSNAASDGSTANYPLYLYRGTDASEKVAGSRAMCRASWGPHYNNDSIDIQYYKNGSTVFDKTHPYIKGDLTFYNSSSTVGYLGVLKHSAPGFLVEGYFHTYQPARHRALNSDYCAQEGVRLARGVQAYFTQLSPETTGYIMGVVKDKSKKVDNSLYKYRSATNDAFWPVMGATVRLYQGETLLKSYITDNNYNGVFVFEDLAPGSYTLKIYASGYADKAVNVTVTANETASPVVYLTPGSGTEPEPEPVVKGIFAYDLNVTQGTDGCTFTFGANSDAVSGRLIFNDATTGTQVGTVALTNVKEGANTVTVGNGQIPGTLGQTLNWSVELTGAPITSITKLNTAASSTFSYTRASVTVDNSPESDFFGSVYVNDLKTRNASKNDASNRDNGIYRYNPLWVRENATPYTGNMAWDNNFRLTTDYRGTLYVPDFGDNHSGVYIADPHNMTDTWQNFFAGSRLLNGDKAGLITNNSENTGSSSPSAFVCGSGASSKLYVSLEDFDYNVYCYDIGSQIDAGGNLPAKWYTAPTLVHEKTKLQYSNTNVIAQEDGAVWVSENLYTTAGNQDNLAAHPALRYITPAHDDYWSYATNSNTPVTGLNGCAGGGFAISNDGTWLVIVDGDGVLQFFDINDSNRNKPLLTWKKSFTPDARDSGCTSVADGRVPKGVYQMAFDWGGNLYVAGGSLGIYSMPTANNTHVTPAKKALTVTKAEETIPLPDPYVVKQDIDTYADNLNLRLTSNWVRSVKDEYDNITFDESGILNRGFAVTSDKVYVTARSENGTNADLALITLDRATGETLTQLDLSNDARTALYGCNDVLVDEGGNVVITNLTIDLANAPLKLFQVNTATGAVTLLAQLTTTVASARVDHCNILGDVSSGNYIVMAAQANGKNIFKWTVTGGVPAAPTVTAATAFYPASATGFGIAPRIYPVDATHAYVTGSNVHPTLYNLGTGGVDDSFAANTAIQPAGINANGLATFTMKNRRFMVYPSEDFRGSQGNKFSLAVSDQGDLAFAHLQRAFEFPTRGLGAVNSQTWGAPVCVDVAANGKSADIFIYVPGEGLASYTVTDITPRTKVRGIYAYALNSTANSDGSYTFTFTPNDDATTASLVFYDLNGNSVGTVSVDNVAGGVPRAITLTQAQIPWNTQEQLRWGVTLTSDDITQVERLDNGGSDYAFTRACPVSDNSPESDYFGRFYVSAFTSSASTENGLYAYNADWSRINSSAYRGGETFGNNYRPGIDYKGTIYFTDWNDAHSGIYLFNPADMSTTAQFFQGTRASSGLWTNNDANVGSSIVSASVGGSGSGTKLYAFLEDFNARNVAVYNIGNADGTVKTSWDTAPSSILTTSSKISNSNTALHADDKGGLWACTYRWGDNTASNPAIIYVDNTGSIVYDSGSLSSLNCSRQAAFAVNKDNTKLAVNDDEGVKIFNITWNGNTPTLSYTGTCFSSGVLNSNNVLNSMAFDYGDNLIVGGAGIAIYSIPTTANTHTTPAKQELILEKQNLPTSATLAQVLGSDSFATGQLYTLADESLTCVYISPDRRTIYLKDDNASVERRDNDGRIDYMGHSGFNTGDQSNWIAVTLPQDAPDCEGRLVSGITGTLTGKVNPALTATVMPTVGSEATYQMNTYSPVNFVPANWELQEYYFLNPKPVEVAQITYAQWDAATGAFVVPANSNGFTGSVQASTAMLYIDGEATTLTPAQLYTHGAIYRFTAVVNKTGAPAGAPARAGESGSGSYVIYPITFTQGDIITRVAEPAAARTPVATELYNLAGQRLPQEPQSGLFIKVTRYSDGSVESKKISK